MHIWKYFFYITFGSQSWSTVWHKYLSNRPKIQLTPANIWLFSTTWNNQVKWLRSSHRLFSACRLSKQWESFVFASPWTVNDWRAVRNRYSTYCTVSVRVRLISVRADWFHVCPSSRTFAAPVLAQEHCGNEPFKCLSLHFELGASLKPD